MLHRRRRLAARFLAVGLLAATLSAVDSLTFPDTAEARCAGNGNPVNSTFSYFGEVRVSDDPVTGTCNGNQLYTADLIDRNPNDPYCVQVWFKETGIDWTIAKEICGGGTERFEWRDRNSNSRAYQAFCIRNPSSGYFTCGWGTQTSYLGRYYGTNYGY
jgi:hypothetical protein